MQWRSILQFKSNRALAWHSIHLVTDNPYLQFIHPPLIYLVVQKKNRYLHGAMPLLGITLIVFESKKEREFRRRVEKDYLSSS